MDSFTHIALGACMGEAFAGRTVGKKAMLWGILAQSLPDIDFLAAFWLSTTDNLLAHRGFTHSILFCLAITPVIAWFAYRLHTPHNISYTRWVLFIGCVILGHIFLDAFNNYGVGWFEPFSHQRISFDTIYVADPFFSIPPGIALLILLACKSNNRFRRYIWQGGLAASFLYLIYCSGNKLYVTHKIKQALGLQKVQYTNLLITPAPLQSWLWFVAAGNDSAYYTGYKSVFDSQAKMELHYAPCNKQLGALIHNKSDYIKLIRFSQQFYTLQQQGDTFIFNDLRFGQVIGWQNPAESFAFHYYLQPEADNTLVVQRGRFAKWDRQSFFNTDKNQKKLNLQYR